MNEIMTTEHERAVSLHRRIMTDAQIAQESLYDMCTALKEMRDGKLYKELGYSEFNDYCQTEIGISDRQVYKYIAIADKLSADFVNPGSRIGVRKLYLLTTITEEQRTEIVESTDLENTTVRELQAQLAQLKEESELDRKERDNANAAAQRWKDTAKRVQEEKEQAEAAAEEAKEAQETTRTTLRNLLEKKAEQVKKLEAKVQELESRPVEVAVSDNTEEIERLQSELAAAKAELKATQEQHAEKPDVQLPLGVEPIYQKDITAVFKPYLANVVDAVDRLVNFIAEHQNDANYDFFIEKMHAVFDYANQKIQAMKGA